MGRLRLSRATGSELRIGSTTIDPRSLPLIGSGGEAEVFDMGRGLALKVFKPPGHADFASSAEARRGAKERIDTHQTKLPALMKLRVPDRVVMPSELAHERKSGAIAGYAMRMIAGAEPLLRYTDRQFRVTVPRERVIAILRDLHRSVSQIHSSGVVIGDFNDLNVLVADQHAFLIDADSFQFSSFLTPVFTPRFLDPLLTDGRSLVLARPHSAGSDWYAYTTMAMQLLLFVDPYGGIHRGHASVEERVFRRITIFHNDVRYPKPAVPLDTIADDLLHFFRQTFEQDRRGEFPLALLDRTGRAPAPRPQHVIAARGSMTAAQIFTTTGVLVAVMMDRGVPLWLAFENGRFVREDGSVISVGSMDSAMSFVLQKDSTTITKDRRSVVLRSGLAPVSVDTRTIAANSRHRYWIASGQLLRDDRAGSEVIGSVLDRGTRMWVSERFGFGLDGAGAMTLAFLFDAESRGINDAVALPPMDGEIVDSDAAIANDRCWFFATINRRGSLVNRCTLLRRDGTIEGTNEAPHGDAGWLGRIHGRAAAGSFLFAATDDGISRIEASGGTLIVTATYPDAEPFVDASTRLLPSERGLYAVNERSITLLALVAPTG
ncbi:MAG: hypothetical protein ACXVJT_11125 [Thermoanaerobaculia bacterium]